ncbi:tetratricopeptide repeat protein 33-like [Mytilus californianus]|uniref:tetratricopeptide repeat protein 33-like n=1 Tax=Mytilus californianus TaxID=6549 RepID=UPI002245D225|nr:tetratricopeptide repeat protein 33-like [Mytilus californianus]
MTSFSWKKKTGSNVKRSVSTAFEEDTKDDNEQLEGVYWLTLVPHRKVICLEDALSKSSRLKNEGSLLAESERYWEAIKKWDEALQFTPEDETIYEMKAQALLALCEVFPALAMAEKVVKLKPTWWTGYQTLGRAQLGLGEVRQAMKSFSRAVHINPAEEELWKEDFLWSFSLLKQKDDQKKLLEQEIDNSKVKLTELNSSDEEKVTEISNEKQGTSEKNTSLSTIDKHPHEPEIKYLPQNYVHMRDK